MPSVRSIVWLGVVLFAAVTGYYLAQRPDGQPRPAAPARVALVTGGSSPFWQFVVSGAKVAASDYGAVLTVMTPGEGSEGQLLALTSLDASELDGLAISAQNPESMQTRLLRLAEEMPLVTYDSDAPNSNRLCYIGTDNISAGAICAQLVVEALPEGGDIVVLFANFDKDNASRRHKGFVDAIAAANRGADRGPREIAVESDEDASADAESTAPPYRILETMQDNIDAEKCAENIKQALAEHEKVDCFVGMFGYHGPVMLEARLAGDLPDEIKLVAFDEDERVLQGIEEQAIYGTVIQDPFKYGYESVRVLTALHAGRSHELPIANRGSIFLPCESVTANNLAKFRERLSQRK